MASESHKELTPEGLKEWLKNNQTEFGMAMGISISLCFFEDPKIPTDNNLTEREVKPFGIGRKSRLFSSSPKGADASAIACSIINTAQANGIDAKEYLTTIFRTGERRLSLKSD